jgi:hypothetical protein
VVSPARRRGGCSLKSAILCPDFWAQYRFLSEISLLFRVLLNGQVYIAA